MRPDDQRLTRLEENQGFAEHTLEQLSAEMAQINRRLADALARLDRLEHRLDRLMTTVTELSASPEPRGDAPPDTTSPH